jgi:hypothetical protein
MEDFMASTLPIQVQSVYIPSPDELTFRFKMVVGSAVAGIISTVAIGCICLKVLRDLPVLAGGCIAIVGLTCAVVSYLSSESELFKGVEKGQLFWVRVHLFFGANPNQIRGIPSATDCLHYCLLHPKEYPVMHRAALRTASNRQNSSHNVRRRIVPLYSAVDHSYVEIVRVLLAYGADPDQKNGCTSSESPLEKAIQMRTDFLSGSLTKKTDDVRSRTEVQYASDRVVQLVQSAHDAKMKS